MSLSIVCLECTRKLELREFCTMGSLSGLGTRCEGCGTEIHSNGNDILIDYAYVTPDQLAEIKARE